MHYSSQIIVCVVVIYTLWRCIPYLRNLFKGIEPKQSLLNIFYLLVFGVLAIMAFDILRIVVIMLFFI